MSSFKNVAVPFLSILPQYVKKEHDAGAFRSMLKQRQSDEKVLNVDRTLITLENLLLADKGEEYKEVHVLLDHFNSGKKLTLREISFLRQNAKGIMNYIERISGERDAVEQRIKAASTKMDVQNVVLFTLQQIAKHPSFEERAVRAKQIADAQYDYMQTKEYKDKPNSPYDNNEKSTSPRLANKGIMQHTLLAIVAYEQAKLVNMRQSPMQ